MFTGIIQAVGEIQQIQPVDGDVRLHVASPALELGHCKLGDSIAVNGVCLTVTQLMNDSFTADVSVETLQHTTLGGLSSGSSVNLEKAVLPTEPLGGHIVSGHVDGLASIVAVQPDARSTRYNINVPDELAKYIAKKGSVTVDGVSLTVNEVAGTEFSVNIIPHTKDNTVFQTYQVGSNVNLEVDVIARYVERLLTGQHDQQSGLSYQTLMENGFG